MFSVVIPLYNKESTIKKTVQSVLDQAYTEFEIIVVDDGSTDNSRSVVEALKDKRIRLISQENQGVSVARNLGVKSAVNEWIAFLDGDDFWLENHLEEVNGLIKKFPEDKIFATSFVYSDNRNIFKSYRNESAFKIKNYFKEAAKETLMWTSIVVVHKDCIEKVGGFNEILNRGEDLDLWARLARCYDIVKSGEITAVYNVGVLDSLSKGKSEYSKSIVSTINLKGLRSYERKYFKRMLCSRMKMDVKDFDVYGVLRVLVKHNVQLLY